MKPDITNIEFLEQCLKLAIAYRNNGPAYANSKEYIMMTLTLAHQGILELEREHPLWKLMRQIVKTPKTKPPDEIITEWLDDTCCG